VFACFGEDRLLTAFFPSKITEPSTRLSLERAREYDRISEILAANKVSARLDEVDEEGREVEFGMEGRRLQFDKKSYRQPVLTQGPMLPRPYRWGQPDALADECKERIRSLRDYNLMDERNARPSDEEEIQAASSYTLS
jgi:hypothetical protein